MSTLLILALFGAACTTSGGFTRPSDPVLVPPTQYITWAFGDSHQAGANPFVTYEGVSIRACDAPPESGFTVFGQCRVSWNQHLNQTGTPVENFAIGGAAFTYQTVTPQMTIYTIGTVIRLYVDKYGAPLNIVIGGGANDLKELKSHDSILAAMKVISSYLAINAPHSNVFWLTTPPGPADGQGPGLNDRAGRQEFNDKLMALGGTEEFNNQKVIDCSASVADPEHPEYMLPAFVFHEYPNDNHIHMNSDAGEVYSDCVVAGMSG